MHEPLAPSRAMVSAAPSAAPDSESQCTSSVSTFMQASRADNREIASGFDGYLGSKTTETLSARVFRDG